MTQITKIQKYKNTKIKCVGRQAIFSICSVWSLTHCHSWNSLPCIHQQFSIITPPATDHLLQPSPTPTPHLQERKKTRSNRLGTPLSRGGWEARRAFGPSTHYRITSYIEIFMDDSVKDLYKNCHLIPWDFFFCWS